MRDIAMFVAMLAMVPMAFMNGFVAFLFWGYTTVLTPVHYLHGFMQGVRYNFIFAIIALGFLFLKKMDSNKVKLAPTYWLIVAFLIHANLSALFALSPNPLIPERYETIMKGFAFILAIPYFVKSRTSIHALLAMLALGLGMHGVVEGLKFIASGGAHKMSGIGNSSLTDNNLFALGMVMVLPILLYFVNILTSNFAKFASLTAALLTILTIIATNSRGGFLALLILGIWYFVASRRKGFALLAIVVFAGLVLAVAPDSWFDRVSSIENANEDESFMNRVAAWRVSLSIGLSNPIFGGGFSAIQNYWVWDAYKSMPSIFSVDVSLYSPKAAHSIYFQILGDMGFVGLFLFLALLSSAYMNRRSIKRRIRENDRQDLLWAIDLSDTMFLSLLAYMVGGAGVSLTYYEVVYILISLLSVLDNIVDLHIRENKS
jgi:probable O-glycosylation ligase (exosortase A-associated)